MIEFKPLKSEEEQLDQPQRNSSAMQNYRIAKSRAPHLKDFNTAVEYFYYETLEAVKKLYSTLADPADKKAYAKAMHRDSLTYLHEFILPTFYLSLNCNSDYKYIIEYRLRNCPFEKEIKDLLKMQSQLEERMFYKKNLLQFYEQNLRIMDEKYFTVL